MASGGVGSQYLRSAPVRRLRHPLDDSPVWSLLGSALGALVAILVGLPVLLVLAVLLPFTLATRWFLLLLYWNRHRTLISADNVGGVSGGAESMRGNDCRWLGTAWRCSVLHAVLVFDCQLEVGMLQQLLLTRVLSTYPRLTHRLHKLPLSAGAGHCWLPDPHFDIDRHVFHGPCLTSDQQLQSYVSRLLGEGLLTDKPPWELHMLPSCDGGRQGTTMVLRVHQSVGDGPALIAMLCRCLADTKLASHTTSRREQPMGFYCKLVRSCLLGPLTVFLWLLLSARDCNLLTQRSSWTGQTSVSWSAAITLAKVTRVKQVTRSTINCVLLSALAGALRVLLQSCGVRQPPDLRVVIPVDLRTSADSRLGSQVAPVVVSLPVGVEGAVPRLWSTRRALRTLRQSSDALVVYLATAALMTLLPSQSARSILSAFTEQKASLQFSSVVGPSAAVMVGGCPLKSVYSLLPAQEGLSMAVSVLTYADQLFVTVATDSSLEPAGNMILSHLQSQVELMYTLLKNRRVPGEVKTETMYRFPDVTRSPVRELASRLSLVQGEVERLSRSHSEASSHETERLHRLRAEFSHLLRELRKRKSLSEVEGWDVQWRLRRRAMSCSFSRRSSMSVVGLLSTNRPASVIETSHPNPLHSTIAFNNIPSTSGHLTSVFNVVNYKSDSSMPSLDLVSSPISAPKYSCVYDHDENKRLLENNNRVSRGLYDEILSALESNETLSSISNEKYIDDASSASPENITAVVKTNNRKGNRYRLETSNLAFRDHLSSNFASAEISFKNRSNLRKYKSKTMNSVYDKSFYHRWRRQDNCESFEGKPRMSRSCNLLSGCHFNNDYEIAIESLSDFATKIRRLSLENTFVDRSYKPPGYGMELNSVLYRQIKTIDSSRRHSTIPLRKMSSSNNPQLPSGTVASADSSLQSSVPLQPYIYEFV